MKRRLTALAIVLACAGSSGAAEGRVVISEICWTAPAFVELHNPGVAPLKLNGYRLLGDVRHAFANATELPPGGRLILTVSVEPAERWGCQVVQSWSGAPRREGELRLYDAEGALVDQVTYRAPPQGSLHRSSDTSAYRGPKNWSPGAPTPGKGPPAMFRLPSLLLDGPRLSPTQARPNASVTVSVRAHGASESARGRVVWRSRHGEGTADLVPAPGAGPWVEFKGAVPGLPDLTLVQVTFVVEDSDGPVSLSTADDGTPLRFYVLGDPHTQLPLYCLEVDPKRLPVLLDRPERQRFRVVFVEIKEGRAVIYDGVTLQVRGGTWTRRWLKKNWVLNFSARHAFEGNRQINLRSGWHDRSSLREILSFDLYRQAGVPSPRAKPVRVSLNGEDFGFYAQLEMIDAAFLARNGMGGGVLYQAQVPKRQSGSERCDARAYPHVVGYESHWNKRTHGGEGYEDLASFVEGFHTTPPEELEAYFARTLEVETYLNYLAVTAFITHWDSLVKNYYWCFDRERSGRWVVIPWDLDRTWGDDYRQTGFTDAPIFEGTKDRPIPGNRNWFNWLREKFLSVPAFRRRYVERVLTLVAREASPLRLNAQIDKHTQVLREEILSDRARWGDYAHSEADFDSYVRGPFARKDLDLAIAQLRSYVKNRVGYLYRHGTTILRNLDFEFTTRQPRTAASSLGEDDQGRTGTGWIFLLPVLVFIYFASGFGKERRL